MPFLCAKYLLQTQAAEKDGDGGVDENNDGAESNQEEGKPDGGVPGAEAGVEVIVDDANNQDRKLCEVTCLCPSPGKSISVLCTTKLQCNNRIDFTLPFSSI